MEILQELKSTSDAYYLLGLLCGIGGYFIVRLISKLGLVLINYVVKKLNTKKSN